MPLRRRHDGSFGWGALCQTLPPDEKGGVYVKYLRRGPRGGPPSGSEVLSQLQAAAQAAPDVRRLWLQDASAVACGPPRARLSLALLSLVRHGETWYERQGFVPRASSAVPHSQRGRQRSILKHRHRDLAAFLAEPMEPIRRAIQAQVDRAVRLAAAGRPVTFAPAKAKLWRLTASNRQLVCLPTVASVLWHRRQILRMLGPAPLSATLGQWLRSLPCAEFALFFHAMYGNYVPMERDPAVLKLAGVRTPTLASFQRMAGITTPYLFEWEWLPQRMAMATSKIRP